MTSINTLTRRVTTLVAKVPQKENILAHPEWPVLRSTIMQTLEAYPNIKAKVMLIMAPLENLTTCDPIVMREAIFCTLEPFNDARIAVARALLALGKDPDYIQRYGRV